MLKLEVIQYSRFHKLVLVKIDQKAPRDGDLGVRTTSSINILR